MESSDEASLSAAEQLHEYDRAEKLALHAAYPATLWWQPILLALGTPIVVAIERVDWFTGVLGLGLALLGLAVFALADKRRRQRVHSRRTRLRGASYHKVAGTMFVALVVLLCASNLAASTTVSTWVLSTAGFGVSWLAWAVFMGVSRAEFVTTSRSS